MNSIELTAHAKVNLFLKVLGRRKDSHHTILTVFERISLADRIRISKIPKGIIISSNRFITRFPKDNLVYKAADLMLKHGGLRCGVRIEIKKNIPIAAGLGGGSSDAAAVISGMNKLFGLKIENPRMVRLGARLGADVPFFILDKSFAIGRGRGERLKGIASKRRFWHLIVYPNIHLSTKEIYDSLDSLRQERPPLPRCLTTDSYNVKIHSLLRIPMDIGTAESMLHNDLEVVAIRKKGIIGDVIECLTASLGKKAVVTGSGPSVFCLYRTRKEAESARREFLRRVPSRDRIGWRILIAQTC